MKAKGGIGLRESMTGVERMRCMLARKPMDRIPVYEHFWPETRKLWSETGIIEDGVLYEDHFKLDMQEAAPCNMVADLDFTPETIEETDETILVRDGNGALLRRHKLHASTPEHVDFLMKDRSGWEEHIRDFLVPDRRRINFELYRTRRKQAAENNRFFTWSTIHVFELIKNVCGHEYLLMGMALDPGWVQEMVMVYSKLLVDLQEILFSEEGYPDGIYYAEDMGFKQKPFFSPAMYEEIIQPGHILTIEYAHSHKMPVIMHSCGMVESLLPGIIKSGVDCLHAIEVKAGMDLIRIHKNYGDVLSFMGGLDIRALSGNNRDEIDFELESKIPIVKNGYGFALHTDHSIPPTVKHETYLYFIEKGLSLGWY